MSYRFSWFTELALVLAVALAGCGESRSNGAAAEESRGGAEQETAATRPARAVQGSALAERRRDDWYGLYVGDKKVGFAHFQVGRDGVVVRSRVDVTVRGAGAEELRITETKSFEGRPPHRLLEVEVREHGSDGDSTSRARRHGDQMVSGQRRARSDETLETELVESLAAIEGWQVGREARVAQFDLDLFRDRVARVQVVDTAVVKTMGVDTHKVVVDFWAEGESIPVRSIYDRSGRLLRGANGDFKFRLEDASRARSAIEGFDVIGDAVPVDRKLGDPAERDRLDLIVKTRADFQMPDAANQEVSRGPDGRWRVTRKRAPGSPLSADDRSLTFASDQYDFGQPQVAALANKLGAGRLAPRAYARKVVGWVYDNLDKDLATNLSRASQVLERKVGDCTEHSLLTIALLRAAGIPAREVSGLIYMGDDVQRFGFHSWVEVGLDGHWVPVDPSWNQMLADPSHLKLGVGDSAQWLGTMASLEIEVLGARR